MTYVTPSLKSVEFAFLFGGGSSVNAKIGFGLLVAVLAIASLGLFLQGTPTGQVALATGQEKITIGAIQPLTGSAASVGQGARAAIELAVEEINAKGGINGKRLEVLIEDSKCDATAASTAAKKLIEIDNVPVIIGGLCSGETIAVAPFAEKAKVVLFSNCSSNPKISGLGDFVFRDFPSDSFQGKIAAELAFNKLNARKVAVFSCQTDYCAGIREVFKEEFSKIGGAIVADELFDQQTNDVRTQLLKIKETNPDLVYFLAYSAEAAVGIRQAKELGLEKPMLGADAWDDPALWSTVGNAGEGAMYTAVFSPKNEKFMEALALKVGKGNETLYCSGQAFDAVKIIADAMRQCGTESSCIKNALYKLQDYKGISGTISFDKNGDLATANYAIKIVKNGTAEEYRG